MDKEFDEKVKQLLPASPGWEVRCDLSPTCDVVLWALMEDGKIFPVVYNPKSYRLEVADADNECLVPKGTQ